LGEVLAERLIALLESDPKLKQNELSEQMDVSLTAIQRLTKELVSKGVLSRKGGKRFGYWAVKRN
jgi:ATP-dependent DNA helicase RecG